LRKYLDQNAAQENRFVLVVFPCSSLMMIFYSDSIEESKNNLPPFDSALIELLSFEETELMALIRQAEADQNHLQEKLKKCNRDVQSQIEAIAEEDSKLENIVKQFV
jgi:hypothetical protein